MTREENIASPMALPNVHPSPSRKYFTWKGIGETRKLVNVSSVGLGDALWHGAQWHCGIVAWGSVAHVQAPHEDWGHGCNATDGSLIILPTDYKERSNKKRQDASPGTGAGADNDVDATRGYR
jgi:hypothetical protein